MKIVRIVRYFEYPNIIQQTPESSGLWNDYFFTEEEIDECDYLVILDYPGKAIRTKVSLDNIYTAALEKPLALGYLKSGFFYPKRVFN